jgi:hypothetical protein
MPGLGIMSENELFMAFLAGNADEMQNRPEFHNVQGFNFLYPDSLSWVTKMYLMAGN